MKRRFLTVILLFPLVGFSQLYFQERPLDVPYVPSKPEVVAKMLEMAKVSKNDILYDLGCGDGRIVITAAERYGTRGVGIDIDAERIKESQENAVAANVTNLVTFIEQDLFEADFHEATVVSLYLLTSVNLRLRPRLLAQLRPGTRVVSHNYAMDTWKPDDSAVVMVNEQSHTVYFWVVPANISGTWEGSFAGGLERVAFSLELDQHFQYPAGKIKLGGAEIPLQDISLNGDKLSFTAVKDDGKNPQALVFSGRAGGDSLQGTVEIQGQGKSNQRQWKAKRDPLTIKPLDSAERGNERKV
ncbi:MAG: class I SAM-dependent methyltransferase [Acidobacteriota bacterium]